MDIKLFTLLVFFSCSFLISCSDDNGLNSLSIGDKFISSQTQVVLIDSFSLNLSTIVVDSFPANNPTNLLVGKYTDDYLGKTSSTSYFQIGIPEYGSIEKDAVFDSLTIVLKYNGMVYGDTMQPQTLFVHEVLEDIDETDDYYIYNTSSFGYNQSPIGSKTFIPRPNIDDSLTIRLDDNLGQAFLQMMKDKQKEMDSTEEFVKFFKGLAIVPGNENSAVLGFECADSLLQVKLYTHLVRQTRVDIDYTFSLYSSETCFNSIKTDRTGTDVESLKNQKVKLLSVASGNKTFIQGGSGIMARVDFTGLNAVMEINKRNVLYKAELVLRPLDKSSTQVDFPQQIILYTSDKNNNLISSVQDDNDNTLVADFYFDKMYSKDSYYKFDITDFIRNELSDGYFDPDNGLVVSLASNKMQSSFDRLVIDSRNSDLYRPVLNLYFVFYN